MIHNIFNSKITFLINGSSYTANQDPNTAVAVDDPREITSVLTPNGDSVNYGSNQQAPITLDFSVVNLSKAVYQLLVNCWNKNLENDLDYKFKIVIQGYNSVGEEVKESYTNCVMRQSPMQTSIGQDIPVCRILVNCAKLEIV